MHGAAWVLSAALLAGPRGEATGADLPAAAAPLRLPHCVVTLIDQAQAPARVAGVLAELTVSEGDSVALGDLLARLDDRDAKARREVAALELRVASEQAASDVRVRAIAAEARVAELQFLQLSGGQPQDGRPAEDELRRLLVAPERTELQRDVAELDFRLAGLSRDVRAAELDLAETELDQRRLAAPLPGVVVQLHRRVGEWVNPGDPVAHIVRMDRLRVEGFVSAAEFTPAELLERPARATAVLARGRKEAFACRVAFASPLVEADGRYRVWAEVENRQEDGQWLLRPGLKAELEIWPGETAGRDAG